MSDATATAAADTPAARLPLSWEEFHRHTRALAARLAAIGNWRGIVAVPRGGLVPAAIVARELGLRWVDTLCVVSYQHQTRGEARVLKPLHDPQDGAGLIVVDEIADTGRTLELVRTLLPAAHIASVIVKPAALHLVHTHILEVAQDTWVDMPWDTGLDYTPPLVGDEGCR